jgi:hypothetical protein
MRRRSDMRSPVFACKLAAARRIEKEFSGWHVWVSNLGRYWAVRQGPDARCSRDDPRPMTLDGDDPEALRTALAEAEQAHSVTLEASLLARHAAGITGAASCGFHHKTECGQQ